MFSITFACISSFSDDFHFMVSFLLVSLSSDFNAFLYYHYKALPSLSCILYGNCNFIECCLIFHIELFQDRSGSKDLSKLLSWLNFIPVGSLQAKFFECATDATLCYRLQKLFCANTWERICIEIENLKTWCLLADDFCQNFDCSLSVCDRNYITIDRSISNKPWRIAGEIKVFNGADGGVEKGLHNDLTFTLVAAIVWFFTKSSKSKMCQWWIALDYLPKKTCHNHPCFLFKLTYISQFKMLELGAALYHSRHHILL